MSATIKIGGIIGAILLLLAVPQLYFMTDYSGGEVWWKGDEAVLFLGAGHSGLHVSYLGYPWARLKEHFYSPPIPQNDITAAFSVLITPNGLQRQLLEFANPAEVPMFLTPFDQGFFALCPGLVVCKWTDGGFMPATAQEVREIGGSDRLIPGPIGDKPVNGWEHRSLVVEPGSEFTISVGGKFSLVVKNRAREKLANPIVSIDLLRPGRAPENLYNVDGTPHRVSRGEYEQVFPSAK